MLKCNPLKNKATMAALNPHAPEQKKRAAAEASKGKAKKAKKTKAMREMQTKYYKSMIAEE